MDSDKILVINDGHVVEEGSHSELLAKNGPYSVLYNSQFSKVHNAEANDSPTEDIDAIHLVKETDSSKEE